MRRASPQATNSTKAMAFDDLSKGCVFSLPDHKHDEPWAVVKNMEACPGGGIRVRPCQYEVAFRDPETGLLISEPVLSIIIYERQAKSLVRLLVTATKVYRWEVFATTDNLRLLFSFTTPLTQPPSYACFLNYLYLATGTNYVVEWDGITTPKYKSQDWWEGYRKPAVVCVLDGLLVFGGFRDVVGASPNSEIATTGAENADQLIYAPLVINSTDTDMIIGMAAPSWGLAVGKGKNTYRVLGSDFTLGSEDIAQRLHTPLAGFAGPWASFVGPNDEVFFVDKRGVFAASNMMQPAVEISSPVGPVFGNGQSMTAVPTPLAGTDLTSACMAYNPLTHQLLVTMPGYYP